MSKLTAEQLEIIERNRQAAIKKRAASLSSQKNAPTHSTSGIPSNNFYPSKIAPTASSATASPSNPFCIGPSPAVQSSTPSYDNKTRPQTSVHPFFNTKSIASTKHLGKLGQSITSVSAKQTIPKQPHSYGCKPQMKLPFELKPCTFRLISRERFVADVGYHERVLRIFKAIPSALYDSKCKNWNFHLRDHTKLLSALQDIASEVTTTGLPSFVLKLFKDNSLQNEPPVGLDLSRIDSTLVNSLMPFQNDGICFGISKEGRCLIADDMGLGKTIQALGIAHYYKDEWPLLIVTPSSVRFVWEDAILSWLPSVPHHHVVVMTSGKDYIGDARILIMSYDLLSRHEDEIKKIKFGVVIMDESHFLKSHKTARTKAGLNVMKRAKRVLLLSGTPALSRPVELYAQINGIAPYAFSSFHDFGIRYCDGKKSTFGWDFSGSSSMEELQILLEARVMIRRLKSDVMTQLPEKNRQMVILDSSKINTKTKQMTSYEKMLGSRDLVGMERRGTLMQYYATTGTAKLGAIREYVTDLLESDKKFICFAHHKYVMDGISDIVEKKNIKYIRIDGSTNPKIRQDLCNSFQDEHDVRLAVLSITAANAGITLTAANLVVFAELFWNPGILSQAEDRAHRIGQRDSVLVQYLVAKGTADDHIWPLILEKLDVLNKAGLSKDNFVQSESVHQKRDSKQKTLDSYFEELLVEDDDWLAGVNLDDIIIPDCDTDIPEKKAKLAL